MPPKSVLQSRSKNTFRSEFQSPARTKTRVILLHQTGTTRQPSKMSDLQLGWFGLGSDLYSGLRYLTTFLAALISNFHECGQKPRWCRCSNNQSESRSRQ